jgi:hypothetical protein
MHFLRNIVLAWSIFVTQSSETVLNRHFQDKNGPNTLSRREAAAMLPLPSLDPFFVPPANWKSQSPGTVLRTRSSAYPNITIGNAMDTFQVMYASTDSNNNATWYVSRAFGLL